MAGESTLRLFVAVYPPLEMAGTLLEAVERLSLPAHRPAPPEQVHLTLQFIGDTPGRDVERVVESVGRAVSGLPGFSLGPRRLISLPERGRPRLIAAETDAPGTLLELRHRLATRLARNARERAGDRFRPHLTLCRFSTGDAPRIDQPVSVGVFEVGAVLLMRSVLLPGGAVHREVVRVPLESV